MFPIPTDYTIFRQEGDSVTLRHSASTPAEPRLIIIDRHMATYDAKNGRWSVPSYRVRVIRGLVDGDGAPRSERLLVDATFRTPIGAESLFTSELLPDFITVVDSEGFGDAVISQTLPGCCPDEP